MNKTAAAAVATVLLAGCSSNPVEQAADVCQETLGSAFQADVASDGNSVTVRGAGRDASGPARSNTLNTLGCLLAETDAPAAVVSAIERTRAIDGVQRYDWDGAEASWTYHPEAGFNLTLEVR